MRYTILLILSLFLIYCNAMLNSVNDEGQTPFMYGLIYHDDIEIYNFLLENGVYTDVKDNYGKSTLWYSIKYNRINTFKLLLASGVVVDKESEKILLNDQNFIKWSKLYWC